MLSAKESPEFRFAVGHHFAHTLRVRRKKFSITKQRERVSGLTSEIGIEKKKIGEKCVYPVMMCSKDLAPS